MSIMLARHVLPATLALILVMVSLNAFRVLNDWRQTFTPAITWHSVDVLTPKVSPGGELRLIYHMTVNKTCPADIRGFMVAPDGSVPIRLPVTPGGYTKPSDGPVEAHVNINIPNEADKTLLPLVSGRYAYRVMVTRYCPEGIENDMAVPDAEFEMVLP